MHLNPVRFDADRLDVVVAHRQVLDRDVLERHVLAAVVAAVAADGVEEVVEAPALLDRHERRALAGTALREAEHEPERALLVDEPVDRGDDARGRDHDPLRADLAAVRLAEHRRGLVDRGLVEERLPHPHEHDVGDPHAAVAAELDHLVDDLPRLEVALEAELAGRAERARERAAGLARHARRPEAVMVQQHRLDDRAVVQPERVPRAQVPRAVDRSDVERLVRERAPRQRRASARLIPSIARDRRGARPGGCRGRGAAGSMAPPASPSHATRWSWTCGERESFDVGAGHRGEQDISRKTEAGRSPANAIHLVAAARVAWLGSVRRRSARLPPGLVADG